MGKPPDQAAAKRAWRIATAARRERDAGVAKRRQEKAAYRLIEAANRRVKRGDADLEALYLHHLHRIAKKFPRQFATSIARSTQARYARSLKFIGARMSIASSDPELHAELNKSPGQRRVSKAAKAKQAQGDPRRKQVAKHWATLARAGVPEHKRATRIEQETGIPNVRRIVRELGLRGIKTDIPSRPEIPSSP